MESESTQPVSLKVSQMKELEAKLRSQRRLLHEFYKARRRDDFSDSICLAEAIKKLQEEIVSLVSRIKEALAGTQVGGGKNGS